MALADSRSSEANADKAVNAAMAAKNNLFTNALLQKIETMTANIAKLPGFFALKARRLKSFQSCQKVRHTGRAEDSLCTDLNRKITR